MITTTGFITHYPIGWSTGTNTGISGGISLDPDFYNILFSVERRRRYILNGEKKPMRMNEKIIPLTLIMGLRCMAAKSCRYTPSEQW